MKRIRSKLVLALLVVALIPVLPSYYMANGLVNHLMNLGFNDTVDQAIDGAVFIAAELHHYYEAETIAVAAQLAASEHVQRLLLSEGVSRDGSELIVPASYRVEAYDPQAHLVASQAHGLDKAEVVDVTRPLAPPFWMNVDVDTGVTDEENDGLGDRLSSLVDLDSQADPRFYRDSLAVLATKTAVEILSSANDPRLITVLAPVEEATLGFVVVTRLLPDQHGRTTVQLSGLQEVFQAVDEHQAQIQMAVRVMFWLFYALVAFFALIVGYLMSRRLTKPLLALVDGTQRVAAGDLDYRLDVVSKDEIGQLMDSFNKMITQIKVNQRQAMPRETQPQSVAEHGRPASGASEGP